MFQCISSTCIIFSGFLSTYIMFQCIPSTRTVFQWIPQHLYNVSEHCSLVCTLLKARPPWYSSFPCCSGWAATSHPFFSTLSSWPINQSWNPWQASWHEGFFLNCFHKFWMSLLPLTLELDGKEWTTTSAVYSDHDIAADLFFQTF